MSQASNHDSSDLDISITHLLDSGADSRQEMNKVLDDQTLDIDPPTQEQDLELQDKIILDDSLDSFSDLNQIDELIGDQEFKDEHIELFFDKISVSQLYIPEYVEEDSEMEIPDVEIIESQDILPDFGSRELLGTAYDSQLLGSSESLKSLDLGEIQKSQILQDPLEEPNQGEDMDFFAKIKVNQDLYDQFGNLLQKPKSIFTTLDRFYVRPLSYLNLDIVNSAEYTKKSQKLDAALEFLNSDKSKTLLAEVAPPESSGLLTVNVKDPALQYSLIPPKSRKEYKEYVSHRYASFINIRPWFMWGITLIQAILVVVSFIMNFNNTDGVIQTTPFNPMIGPNPGILIALGARYLPCMKYIPANWSNLICPVGVKVKPLPNETCTLADICRSTSETNPDQGWRFVTPTFLHSGVVHFVLNGFFQLRVATNFEREVGTLQIAAVFFISSTVGYIFGGALSFSAKDTPSVGSSGGLFGIIACLTVDLFMNWSYLSNPKWEAFKTVANIVVAFLMGLLPGVDNFSHIGGYICGLFMAVLVLPKIYVSRKDRERKKILQYLSLPSLVIFTAVCLYGFYKADFDCYSCQYLNCIPGLPWCKQKGVNF